MRDTLDICSVGTDVVSLSEEYKASDVWISLPDQHIIPVEGEGFYGVLVSPPIIGAIKLVALQPSHWAPSSSDCQAGPLKLFTCEFFVILSHSPSPCIFRASFPCIPYRGLQWMYNPGLDKC